MEKHLLDEWNIRQQFPIISGFENQLEMSRWENQLTNIKRSSRYASEGSYSLKVDFLPGRYPNISLSHFKGDWTGYKTLSFVLFNASNETQKFTMKVYDLKHSRRGRRYNDRFNRQLTLKPGWNTIETSLIEIQKAPKNRPMNMHQIKGFSLFSDKLPQPVTLYIDNIHLS